MLTYSSLADLVLASQVPEDYKKEFLVGMYSDCVRGQGRIPDPEVIEKMLSSKLKKDSL